MLLGIIVGASVSRGSLGAESVTSDSSILMDHESNDRHLLLTVHQHSFELYYLVSLFLHYLVSTVLC